MNVMLHKSIILPVMKELKGYVNFFIFDCQHPDVLDSKVTFQQI